jgi:hypothetical protein
MFKFCALALLSYAAADFKFIGTGDGHAADECIDIKAPCKDGKETAKCPRLEGKELQKGTNIQMWKCHGEDNQAFEFVNGRIRNAPTGLCLDIKADCKDGSDKAACERESVEDIKKKDSANVQLWTCRKDDANGFASKSYGNQKFDFKLDGTLKNELTGFCLTAHEGASATNGMNVEVHKCDDAEVANHMQWDYFAAAAAAPARLYSDSGPLLAPKSSRPMVVAAVAAMCVAGVTAAVAVVRSRRPAYPIPLQE